MALFTDGEISSIGDLQGYDTQLLEVANTEGIDVTRKLQLAQDEISVEVATLLGRLRVPQSADRVVVTAPLKLWHTFLALELVYRDAYNSQLNDRYAGKRDEFHGMAKWAYEKVIQGGLGIANDPVERATTPEVQVCAGGVPDGTYYVAAAWVNAGGGEGAASVPAMIETAGSSFSVRANASRANVKGWNVYVGTAPQSLIQQNNGPLDTDESWAQPGAIQTGGKPASGGQLPDYLLAVPRLIQRG
jgi:hypothetical protein